MKIHKRKNSKPLMITALGVIFLIVGCKNKVVIPTPLDPQTIAQISGRKNLSGKNDVFSTQWKRDDWKTTSDGIVITSDFGFNSEFSVQGTQEKTTLLADLRIPQSQMQTILRTVLLQGFEVQSLHNTYLDDHPTIQSLHLSSNGSATEVATRLKSLIDDLDALPPLNKVKEQKPRKITEGTLDPKEMQKILWDGEWRNRVYRVERGRGTTLEGVSLGGSTGVKSWAAFQGSEQEAVMTGDIATIQDDLNEILKIITEAGIKIVSIHTHFNEEKPRLVFVHVWGQGPVKVLANAFKEAVSVNESHQSN